MAADHRIDAFYRKGDRFLPASTLVSVVNAQYQSRVTVTEDTLKVEFMPPEGVTWSVNSVSLADSTPDGLRRIHSFRTINAAGRSESDLGTKGVTLSWNLSDAESESVRSWAHGESRWTAFDVFDAEAREPISLVGPVEGEVEVSIDDG